MEKRKVDSIFTEVDRSPSIYKENSLISIFNNSISGVEMDEYLHKVVAKLLGISKKSGGVFDMQRAH